MKSKRFKTHTILPQMMKVGQFVIVEEWYAQDLPNVIYGAKPRPIGLPVKILSIALPIIAVEFCAITGLRGTMDTRQAKFTRVPLQYVRALVPDYDKKPVLKEIDHVEMD